MYHTIEDQNIRPLPEGLTISGLIAELEQCLAEHGDLEVAVHHAGNPAHMSGPGQWWGIPLVQTQAHSDRLWLVH